MELAPRHSVTFFLVIVLPQRSSIRKLGGMANLGDTKSNEEDVGEKK
jgi:hypothetical protein